MRGEGGEDGGLAVAVDADMRQVGGGELAVYAGEVPICCRCSDTVMIRAGVVAVGGDM